MFCLPFDILVSNVLLDRNVISTNLVTNFAEDLKMLLLSYNNKNTFSLLMYYHQIGRFHPFIVYEGP